MKQAETFIEMKAEYPHCAAHIVVEAVDETVNGLEEVVCENCKEPFSYCHPGNIYGLAR